MSSVKCYKRTILNHKLTWTIILFLVAIILSFLKPLELAEGGSSTVFSMFVLFLIGYFRIEMPGNEAQQAKFSWKKLIEVTIFGVLGGVLFGLITFFDANGKEAMAIFDPNATKEMLRCITDTEGNILTSPMPGTYMTDYWGDFIDNVVGYGLIGFGVSFSYILTVFWRRKGGSAEEIERRQKWIMIDGYLVGVILRLIEAVWNVEYYYYAYDHAHNLARIPLAENPLKYFGYSLAYSSGYILAEALLTIAIVANIRPVFRYIRQFMSISVRDYNAELDEILLDRNI